MTAPVLESLHPGGFELTRQALQTSAVWPGARVVDLGCGSGASQVYLRDVYRIAALGFDLRCDVLQAGRAASPELRLACASGGALPLAAHSCDIVLAECSLSTMGGLDAVLAECRRVLAPGGRLAITDLHWRKQTSGPVPDRSGWIDLLETHGFKTLCWEDHSRALSIMAAQAIFSGQPIESLWGCRSTCLIDSNDLKSLGYFLCIAEKI